MTPLLDQTSEHWLIPVVKATPKVCKQRNFKVGSRIVACSSNFCLIGALATVRPQSGAAGSPKSVPSRGVYRKLASTLATATSDEGGFFTRFGAISHHPVRLFTSVSATVARTQATSEWDDVRRESTMACPKSTLQTKLEAVFHTVIHTPTNA
ncbi:unnamed protein product [Protopolystoma xenopodis]|uniref:Uncharacterized protein n=1 Tax=Protopolystoma xenopodis TaxID=117903 RepID=A0A448X5S5_9PLAT|nr:unnamed protein product [Protopolystoma xenopodis]